MAWTFTNLTANVLGVTVLPRSLGPSGSASASWTGNISYDALNSAEIIHLVGVSALSVTWAADSGAVPGTELITRSSERFYDMDMYPGTWDSLTAQTTAFNATLDLESKGGLLKVAIPDFTQQAMTVSTALGDLRGRPIHLESTITAFDAAIIPPLTNHDVLGTVVANTSLPGQQMWAVVGAAVAGVAEALTVDITTAAGVSLLTAPVVMTGVAAGLPTALPFAADPIPAGTVLMISCAYAPGGAPTFESLTVYADGYDAVETYTSGLTRVPAAFATAVAEVNADVACAVGETATVDIQIVGGGSILTAPAAITSATVYPLDMPVAPGSLPIAANTDLVAIIAHTKGVVVSTWAGVSINLIGQVDTPRQAAFGFLPAAAFIRNNQVLLSLSEPLAVGESIDIDIWNNSIPGTILNPAGPVTIAGPQAVAAPIAIPTVATVLAANTELEARINAYVPGGAPTGLGLELYADYNLQTSNFVEGFPTILTAGSMASAKAWINAAPAAGETVAVDIMNSGVSMLAAPVTITSASPTYTAIPLALGAAPALAANAMLEARLTHTSLSAPTNPTVTVEFRESVPAGTGETLDLGSVNRPGTVVGAYVVANNQAAAGESLTVMVTKGTAAGTTNLLSGVMTLNNTITARTRVTGSLSAVAGATTVAVTDVFSAVLAYTAGAGPTPLRDVSVVIVVRPSDA